MARNSEFTGRKLYLRWQPEWRNVERAQIRGATTVYLLSQHPGIKYETYKAMGGSTMALRRAVKQEAVNAI